MISSLYNQVSVTALSGTKLTDAPDLVTFQRVPIELDALRISGSVTNALENGLSQVLVNSAGMGDQTGWSCRVITISSPGCTQSSKVPNVFWASRAPILSIKPQLR